MSVSLLAGDGSSENMRVIILPSAMTLKICFACGAILLPVKTVSVLTQIGECGEASVSNGYTGVDTFGGKDAYSCEGENLVVAEKLRSAPPCARLLALWGTSVR